VPHDHRDPTNRPVDSTERSEYLQSRRYIEFQAAIALRHEHTKDANRSQRFHQIGRYSATGLDLRCACGDVRRKFLDISEQTLRSVYHKSLKIGISWRPI
jgi:hypothetical protein